MVLAFALFGFSHFMCSGPKSPYWPNPLPPWDHSRQHLLHFLPVLFTDGQLERFLHRNNSKCSVSPFKVSSDLWVAKCIDSEQSRTTCRPLVLGMLYSCFITAKWDWPSDIGCSSVYAFVITLLIQTTEGQLLPFNVWIMKMLLHHHYGWKS